MIKLQNLTPEVYYKQSRDFQFIGRLYDLVLNSVKTNADMIYDIPSSDAAGSKMIDLLTLTLGFKPRHNYSVKQLAAICSIFQKILKNKGSLYAIELATTALLHSEGITTESSVYYDEKNYSVNILISPELSDLNLLNDLLLYILPAGLSCNITRAATFNIDDVDTKIYTQHKILHSKTNNTNYAQHFDGKTLEPATAETPNGYVDKTTRAPGFTINSAIYKGDTDNE